MQHELWPVRVTNERHFLSAHKDIAARKEHLYPCACRAQLCKMRPNNRNSHHRTPLCSLNPETYHRDRHFSWLSPVPIYPKIGRDSSQSAFNYSFAIKGRCSSVKPLATPFFLSFSFAIPLPFFFLSFLSFSTSLLCVSFSINFQLPDSSPNLKIKTNHDMTSWRDA